MAAFKNRIFIGRTRAESNRNRQASLICRVRNAPAASPLAKAYQVFTAKISANRELQCEKSGRSTRHIEISLPEGAAYQEGDHLGVLPQNSEVLIGRVFQRFGLNGNEQILISGRNQASHLPLERPVHVKDLFNIASSSRNRPQGPRYASWRLILFVRLISASLKTC